MTVNERIQDISKRTGLSEEIIRRVLGAETESVIESLQRGERATMINRCSFTPSVKTRLALGGSSVETYIKVTAKPSTMIDNHFKQVKHFDSDGKSEMDRLKEIDPDLMIAYIPELQ